MKTKLKSKKIPLLKQIPYPSPGDSNMVARSRLDAVEKELTEMTKKKDIIFNNAKAAIEHLEKLLQDNNIKYSLFDANGLKYD